MRSRKHHIRGVMHRLAQVERQPRSETNPGDRLNFPTDHTTRQILSHSLTWHQRTQLNVGKGFGDGKRKILKSGRARVIRQVVKGSETIE